MICREVAWWSTSMRKIRPRGLSVMAMPPNCVSIAAREPSDGHQRDVPPRKEDQASKFPATPVMYLEWRGIPSMVPPPAQRTWSLRISLRTGSTIQQITSTWCVLPKLQNLANCGSERQEVIFDGNAVKLQQHGQETLT